jgi:hypothetical protein
MCDREQMKSIKMDYKRSWYPLPDTFNPDAAFHRVFFLRSQTAKIHAADVRRLACHAAHLCHGRGFSQVTTNNNPDLSGYIGVFSAGARVRDPTFESQLLEIRKSGVKLYWTGAGDTDLARAATVAWRPI